MVSDHAVTVPNALDDKCTTQTFRQRKQSSRADTRLGHPNLISPYCMTAQTKRKARRPMQLRAEQDYRSPAVGFSAVTKAIAEFKLGLGSAIRSRVLNRKGVKYGVNHRLAARKWWPLETLGTTERHRSQDTPRPPSNPGQFTHIRRARAPKRSPFE
jgi:hypothetical protein